MRRKLTNDIDELEADDLRAATAEDPIVDKMEAMNARDCHCSRCNSSSSCRKESFRKDQVACRNSSRTRGVHSSYRNDGGDEESLGRSREEEFRERQLYRRCIRRLESLSRFHLEKITIQSLP